MSTVSLKTFTQKLLTTPPDRIYREVIHIGHHYPRRCLEMSAYGLRRLRHSAYPEPELTYLQKWQTDYILSGCKTIKAPRGYFPIKRKRLKIINDVQPTHPLLWITNDQVELPLPYTAHPDPDKTSPWKTPTASFMLRIPEGFIAPDGLVFDEQCAYRNGRWYYQSPPDNLPLVKHDRLLTLIQLWSDHFIHFSFDTLPRINFIYPFLKENEDVKILVPDNRLYIEIFRALGIDSERLIPHRQDHVYQANEVYYPHFYSNGHPSKMGLLPANAFQHVRTLFPKGKPGNQIVYLKRNASLKRKVSNEKELLSAIEKSLKPPYQLEIYEPLNDWTKDREIMARARMVFGPHGGAWSNIIFCAEKIDVVEFLPLIRLKNSGKNERPCFYGLACALGLKYWVVEPDHFEFDRDLAMQVPINEVMTVLKKIGVV